MISLMVAVVMCGSRVGGSPMMAMRKVPPIFWARASLGMPAPANHRAITASARHDASLSRFTMTSLLPVGVVRRRMAPRISRAARRGIAIFPAGPGRRPAPARDLLLHRLAYPGQRGAVDVIGAEDHRDPLVGGGDLVVLFPALAAPPGRGAEDVPACEAERVGVGVAGVDQLRLALEHEEPRPPVDVRD